MHCGYKLIHYKSTTYYERQQSYEQSSKSGHPGGAMGGADFINTLYSEFLVYDPENPAWEGRDRFFLDPGHMAPMLYSQLALIGKFTLEDLKNLRQWGSVTPGHPEREIERGIENTSGPLGQGRKSLRVLAVLLVTWVWTTSSCSMTLTTSSCLLRLRW